MLNVEREKQSNWIPRNNLFCSSLVEIKCKWELDSLIHIEKVMHLAQTQYFGKFNWIIINIMGMKDTLWF